MSWRHAASLALLTALMPQPAAAGDTALLTADRDNTLYEDPSGMTSNGSGTYFFSGMTSQGAVRRGLVRFDLSTLPAGSTIESAVLTLNMSMTNSGVQPVSIHAVTADWGEGASDAPGPEGSGAPAAPGDATWLHTFFRTDFWSAPGGDFVAVPSATTMVDQEGAYSWGSNSAIVADVQAWLDDPSGNFGWVVVGNERPSVLGGSGTAKRFDSRDGVDEGTIAPELFVTYTPPVPVELQGFDVD